MDFDSFISKSHSMRMVLESASMKGVATYNDSNGSSQAVSFDNRYDKFGFYDIGERGVYFKLDVSKSKLPIALGFSDVGPATVSFFDARAQFDELAIGIGYDALAYAQRYETNYQGLYFNGAASIGFGNMTLSDSVKQSAQTFLTKKLGNKHSYSGKYLGGELGYLFQQRSRSLNGLGHSFSTGLKFQYSAMDAGYTPDSSSSSTSDTPNVEIRRQDTILGPFVRYNLMF